MLPAGGSGVGRFRSRGLCLLGCSLALIPVLTSCLALGIPFGIWGLVVLHDRQVRAAFS